MISVAQQKWTIFVTDQLIASIKALHITSKGIHQSFMNNREISL